MGPAVPAVDPDDGDSLTYSLGGTDSASFGINGSTGQITVGTGTTPDFETKLRYEVTVTATDSSNLSDTITVTINVTEGNDPPAFATDTATRRVAENTPVSINLGDAFSATDADNNNLTYTLEGTDAASFDIVSTSGQLQTKAVLDYEVKSSYSVTVKAADASANGTIDVTITVTDVNEPPLAPGRPDVSEKSASSVSVTWTAPANEGRPAIMATITNTRRRMSRLGVARPMLRPGSSPAQPSADWIPVRPMMCRRERRTMKARVLGRSQGPAAPATPPRLFPARR